MQPTDLTSTPRSATHRLLQPSDQDGARENDLVGVWRTIATCLPPREQEALQFECKVLARAVSHLVPMSVDVVALPTNDEEETLMATTMPTPILGTWVSSGLMSS